MHVYWTCVDQAGSRPIVQHSMSAERRVEAYISTARRTVAARAASRYPFQGPCPCRSEPQSYMK
eukprot:1121094-Alexandrium_andersonii.AAC.1